MSDSGKYLKVDDIKQFLTDAGFQFGENDLVNMTDSAAKMVMEYLGMYRQCFNPATVEGYENSMKLHPSLLESIVVVYLTMRGYNAAMMNDGTIIGYTGRLMDANINGVVRYSYYVSEHPHQGLGNVHAFSGRVY